MTVQVVILAAGMGSRLGRSLPKPLTELADGRTIMQQQFVNIRAAFGDEAKITVVVGYKLDHIIEAFPEASYVYNDILSTMERIGDHAYNIARITVDPVKTHDEIKIEDEHGNDLY